ncbi:hypothetical protein BpHYR1_047462 [Brachionus plicatilis]|uniref:Uncharacterized protein n=1 Tax=Brachionus plicatilis TaxID=10195 RepID=A0A3M7QNT6_BRAPC|nr:hypothetical protein BpHYR1_047462 [Brachionus plicatilis]
MLVTYSRVMKNNLQIKMNLGLVISNTTSNFYGQDVFDLVFKPDFFTKHLMLCLSISIKKVYLGGKPVRRKAGSIMKPACRTNRHFLSNVYYEHLKIVETIKLPVAFTYLNINTIGNERGNIILIKIQKFQFLYFVKFLKSFIFCFLGFNRIEQKLENENDAVQG